MAGDTDAPGCPAGQAPEQAGAPPGGQILLVGTPIGNLGDLSARAAGALRDAEVIFCEDTRQTRKLLAALGIRSPRLFALHEHNEARAAEHAVRLAGEGRRVVVVSDAGMPAISDPGERLVRAAAVAGVPVGVVPGPSAVLAALVLSGLATARFCFEGFLPRQGGERTARLAAVAAETRTTVIYEAPHRVSKTLLDLGAACGGSRRVALARELTKRFEQVWRGTLAEAVEQPEVAEARGEWVLVVEGAPAATVDDQAIHRALADQRASGGPRRQAVEEVAAALGVPRNRVYRLALESDT